MRAFMILAMAMIFGVWSNSYFGHNMFPKADAEILCDGIVLLMTSLGVLAWNR